MCGSLPYRRHRDHSIFYMKPLLHLSLDSLKDLGIVEWGYTDEAIPRSLAHFNTWVK